ncbi:hypothetical protein NDA16_001141 [Ustilago loliicola]|nr:hypothetical protein NDA16_001141 [Ustilago loliicola]
MQRRYPKRARNVTDYNVKRIFEKYERAQSADAASAPTHTPAPPPKPKKQPLPVVNAKPGFFDALRSKTASKPASGIVPTSFADFLKARLNSEAATAAVRAAALAGTAVTMPPKLTEAEARAITNEQFAPTALWNLSVRTDDRASLWQLKPSTRRWLGISTSSRSTANVDGATTPTLPTGERGPPLKLKLGDLITSHAGPAPNALDLRDDLESFEGAGLIGRPKDALSLESASLAAPVQPETAAAPTAASKPQPIAAAAPAKSSKPLPAFVQTASSRSKQPAPAPVAPPKSPAASKPKAATTSKGTRDLLSYFSTQIASPHPAKPPRPSNHAPAPVPKSTPAKASASKKATVSASAKAKGKARARDTIDADDFEFYPHSSLGSGSQVIVDLTHSSSAPESMAERPPQKRVHSHSASIATSSSKRIAAAQPAEAGKKKKKTVGLGGDRREVLIKQANLRAEIRQKEAERQREEEEVCFWNTEDEEELNGESGNRVTVELPARRNGVVEGKTVKRKRVVHGPDRDSDEDSDSPPATVELSRKSSKQSHPSTAAKVAAKSTAGSSSKAAQ